MRIIIFLLGCFMILRFSLSGTLDWKSIVFTLIYHLITLVLLLTALFYDLIIGILE